MVKEKKWEILLGFPVTKPDGNIEQNHCNLAYAIQNVTNEIVLSFDYANRGSHMDHEEQAKGSSALH